MKFIQGHWVIDESAPPPNPNIHGRGYVPRDYQSHPMHSAKCAFKGTRPRIDPREFQDRILEKTAKKLWITDHCDRVGSHVKDQNGTNYCWINAPTRGLEVFYVLSSGLVLDLSAAYGGSIIKGGANQGGSGIEAVDWIHDHGQPDVKYWPTNKLSRTASQASQECKDSAMKHRIMQWEDMDAGDMDAIFSSVLENVPVTVGIPAWGHEVLITYLVWQNGRVVPGIDNSWAPSWGTNGRGLLTGAYARFDEAGAVISATPAID